MPQYVRPLRGYFLDGLIHTTVWAQTVHVDYLTVRSDGIQIVQMLLAKPVAIDETLKCDGQTNKLMHGRTHRLDCWNSRLGNVWTNIGNRSFLVK